MMDAIIRDITSAYGSVDQPDWSFVAKRFNQRLHQEFVDELRTIGSVSESTDLNDDWSRCLAVTTDSGDVLTVRISLVGKYACVHDERGGFVDKTKLMKGKVFEEVIELLDQRNFEILTEHCLRETIKFGGKTKTLYAILFSDDYLLD